MNEKTNAGSRDWARHVGRTFCKACHLFFANHGSFAGRDGVSGGGEGGVPAGKESHRRESFVAKGRVQEGSIWKKYDADEKEEEVFTGRGSKSRPGASKRYMGVEEEEEVDYNDRGEEEEDGKKQVFSTNVSVCVCLVYHLVTNICKYTYIYIMHILPVYVCISTHM